MKSKSNRPRRIAALIRLRLVSGRDILYGIRRYASRHFEWNLHIVNTFDGETTAELKRLIDEGIDGLIVNGIVFPEVGELVGKLSLPTVVLGARTPEMGRRTDSLVFVRAANDAVGTLAARYMNALGSFRTYAFVPTNQPSYASDLREEGFRHELARRGVTPTVFPPVLSRTDGSTDEITGLATWLKGLPKPIALMAAYDQRALHVMEAAHLSGLRIPRDLSVIGVDNDTLLCEFARPPLTSIQIDHVRIGEIMAQELEKLIVEQGRTRVRSIKTHDLHIVERESAKPVAPSVKLVANALSYINRNALKGIRAADVSAYLRVSRSLLDLRFRETAGTSVKEAILVRRLQEVKRPLTETSTSISKITASCGFKSENSVKNLFRRRFGCTMTEWRAKR